MLLPVGAAFNFFSGTVRRAPSWMQRLGLEWLFRLAMEPRRLFGRYLSTNTRFVALILREEFARIGDRKSVDRGLDAQEPGNK